MLFKADDGVGDVRGFQGCDFHGGQLHVDRSDCIVEMMQLGGTDDRCGDDWFRQEPGERDLCPRYPARLGDFGDPVGDLPIGFVGLGEEPAEGLVGLRADAGVVPVAAQFAARLRAPRDDADTLGCAKLAADDKLGRFAIDSLLEGGGFEPSVPRMRPSPSWPLNLLQL
jgi:hypothetical protein